jgi:hypothetical protein
MTPDPPATSTPAVSTRNATTFNSPPEDIYRPAQRRRDSTPGRTLLLITVGNHDVWGRPGYSVDDKVNGSPHERAERAAAAVDRMNLTGSCRRRERQQ